MTVEAGYGNVHTTNVENGRSLQDNLPNADGAGGRNTAARNARRVPGSSIGTGAWLLHNNALAGELVARLWLEVGARKKERLS